MKLMCVVVVVVVSGVGLDFGNFVSPSSPFSDVSEVIFLLT